MPARPKVPRTQVPPSDRQFEILLRRAAKRQRTSVLRGSAKIAPSKTMRAA